jgi:hypothetical protein
LGDKHAERGNFPILSYLASPGSGKSYAIQELAANIGIMEEWWNKQSSQSNEKYKDLSQKFYEFMKNALRMVVTFNNFTNLQPDSADKDPQIGMCCRILYRFVVLFFTKNFFLRQNSNKTQLLCDSIE